MSVKRIFVEQILSVHEVNGVRQFDPNKLPSPVALCVPPGCVSDVLLIEECGPARRLLAAQIIMGQPFA